MDLAKNYGTMRLQAIFEHQVMLIKLTYLLNVLIVLSVILISHSRTPTSRKRQLVVREI